MYQFALPVSYYEEAGVVIVNAKSKKTTSDRDVAGSSGCAALSGTSPAISERQKIRLFRRKEAAIMKPLRNRFKTGVDATVLLTGLGTAAVAQGFVDGFSSGYIGGVRSPLQINGSVVCSKCSLEEVQQERDLYQLSSKTGQLVFKVATVNEPSMFAALA
jgi:hypothetical protein